MKRSLLLAVLLAAACRRAAPAREGVVLARSVVAGVALIGYAAENGDFSCRAPADWRALEDRDLGPQVMFFGPGSEKYPRSVAIAVTKYPSGGRIKTPEDYWNSLKIADDEPSALETRRLNGRTVYVVHYGVAQRALSGGKILYMKRADVVLIPVRDGFFSISHLAPAQAYRDTLPVFDAIVESFEPKG